MLKALTYLSLIMYMAVYYGQNIFEFGSELRVSFYFIGMSLVHSVFAFTLFKALKNVATSFYLFMCLGEVFNQIVFKGGYDYLEIVLGLLGLIYIIFEKQFKKLLWISKN